MTRTEFHDALVEAIRDLQMFNGIRIQDAPYTGWLADELVPLVHDLRQIERQQQRQATIFRNLQRP